MSVDAERFRTRLQDERKRVLDAIENIHHENPRAMADETPLNAVAGIDRVTILTGKTYLRGWAGYGDPPRPQRPRGPQATDAPPPPPPCAAGLRLACGMIYPRVKRIRAGF